MERLSSISDSMGFTPSTKLKKNKNIVSKLEKFMVIKNNTAQGRLYNLFEGSLKILVQKKKQVSTSVREN